MEILIQLGILVLGFILLIKGADWFVEGASQIAQKFHIPPLVIGLTIVAFGTSAPEAAVSISAGLKGNADLAISNIVGSNILNILLILGITSLVLPLVVQKSTLYFELPFTIFVTAILLILGMIGNSISFIDGIILWGLFLCFFAYLIIIALKDKQNENESTSANTISNNSVLIMLLFTIGGLAAVIIGSNLSVDSVSTIAKIIGLDERTIGLTVVAFGTSLPELITSVTAAKKGETDIAIGNIIGSNIFNILFVIGTTALLTPVPFKNAFLFDSVIAIASAFLLFIFVFKSKRLNRICGGIFLVLYAAYFATLFIL